MTFRQQKTEQGGGKCSDISAFDNTDAPLDSEINPPLYVKLLFLLGHLHEGTGRRTESSFLSILSAQMLGRHDADDLT